MRILCIDDEPLALEMLEEAIQEAKPDADVKAFRKQSELLEEAQQNGCDIAFLDIHMRGMNGVELAKQLKEINPKMNIIFVTGYDEYTGDAMQLRAIGDAVIAHVESCFAREGELCELIDAAQTLEELDAIQWSL